MNEKEIEAFIYFMAKKFMKCYNRVFSHGYYIEEENILGNGYCFYFAHLLNQLIPDSQIVLTQHPFAHYFLCYHNQFYDYRGCIPKEKDHLLVDFDYPTAFSDLIFATDAESEWGYAEINGTTDKLRDSFYNSVIDELLQVGKTYLEEHHLLEQGMKL